DLFPPVVRVYAATIDAGIDGSQAMKLLLWAGPGALIQLLGGPKRQIGVLFATGLLILNPAAGWAVLLAILIRFVVARGKMLDRSPLTVMAAGFIAGDALWSFGSAVFRM
ncbi:OPT/YSL family transporter, partial [Gemmatimonadota bacterium]